LPSSINRPRGTIDVLPGEVEKWQYVEESFRRICREYGYAEIRTPVFEHTELFDRGVGDTTDIIEKEMYTFLDRSERSLSLRPEGTAPIARAYVEDKLFSGPQPVKVYYQGPMFRYDRPQAGRYRQFHQLGVEVFRFCGAGDRCGSSRYGHGFLLALRFEAGPAHKQRRLRRVQASDAR